MSNKNKCNDGKLCTAMVRNLSRTERGFTALELLNMETGDTYPGGVIYKQQSNSRGVMLNFCPWCAGDIRWWKGEVRMHKKDGAPE